MRTRFAPSPTGELHLGGLRTALYSYLLARNDARGKFFLRIEDTDASRTVPGAQERLVEALDRCGLERDDHAVVQQSKRINEYQRVAAALVDRGHAYCCFCSRERLEDLRVIQSSQNQPTKYDGKCSHLSKLQVKDRLAAGEPHTVRMKTPMTGETVVQDEILGRITFPNQACFDDQILLKQDGWPTYHLAATVDDHEMGISHVIRGKEWLTSTPKHLLLYEMMGWDAPKFAHLPLLLTSDGKKLSKRSALGIPVLDLLNSGYLPSTLLNFVLLLGWSEAGSASSPIYHDKQELVDKFSLDQITKSDAIVDADRLAWMNSMHIRRTIEGGDSKSDPKYTYLLDFFQTATENKLSDSKAASVLNLLKDRARFPQDLVELGRHFAQADFQPGTIPQELNRASALAVFEMALSTIDKGEFDALESLHNQPQLQGYRKKEVLTPLRWCLTGLKAGAPLGETAKVLGQEQAARRVRFAMEQLKN